MPRIVEPEILDTLNADHPTALLLRKDIGRFNALLGNHRWFGAVLPRLICPGDRILEIGAGAGELAQKLRPISGAHPYDGVDLWPRPADWPESSFWHRGDLRNFPGYESYNVLLANLILHQFTDSDLQRPAGAWNRHYRIIMASEPARSRRSLFFLGILKRAGMNPHSYHDARVSVRAGFRGNELPALLGLASDRWAIRTRHGLLGSYRMIAVRKPERQP